jgi:hypothetical protein
MSDFVEDFDYDDTGGGFINDYNDYVNGDYYGLDYFDFEENDENLDNLEDFETLKNTRVSNDGETEFNGSILFNDINLRPSMVSDRFKVEKSKFVRRFSFNDIFCTETENRRYIVYKNTIEYAKYSCEADVCGFMNSLINISLFFYYKFNDGYQNVQYQIESMLAEKKKEKNFTRHKGKKKRPVKGKKNTNLTEIVDGRDPVASASEDESESVSQKTEI